MRERPKAQDEVTVRPSRRYTRRIPREMPCDVTMPLVDGFECEATRTDYDGLFARPIDWDDVVAKFDRLAAFFAAAGSRTEIVASVRQLEALRVSESTALLARTGEGQRV